MWASWRNENRADIGKLPERAVEYGEPAGTVAAERDEETIPYEEIDRNALDGEDRVASPTGLAADVAKRYGMNENAAKLHVSKAL